MLKIEANIQNAVNDAYLWVWDRTGITIPMITFPLIAAEFPICSMVVKNSSMTGAIIPLGVWGILCAIRHIAQMSGNFTYCNGIATYWRKIWIKVLIWVPHGIWLTGHYDQWQGWVDTMLVMSWFYVWGCLVRERKPIEKRALIPVLSSSL